MSAVPLQFSHRTGDLQRAGIATALPPLQAKIFGALMTATINNVPIGAAAIARAISEHPDEVEDEIPALIRRVKPLGIRVAYERGRGRWLEFEPVPRFELKIPDPVAIPGERPPW